MIFPEEGGYYLGTFSGNVLAADGKCASGQRFSGQEYFGPRPAGTQSAVW